MSLAASIRSLVRHPGFAFAAIGILALGIGVSTASYSALRAFAFAPLPFREADQLVWLKSQHARTGGDLGVCYADFLDWRTAPSLGSTAYLNVRWNGNVTAPGQSQTETLRTTFCTWNLFEVLGVQPVLGRGLTAADDLAGAPRVVLISHALWQQMFAGEASVIGRNLRVDGDELAIVGVLPPRLRFPSQSDLWIPMAAFFQKYVENRGFRADQAIARLAPGATAAAADAELRAIGERLAQAHPKTNAEVVARVVPFRAPGATPVLASLQGILLASGCLLLIACANVSGLFFARGLERAREFAVRLALGSSRGGLARTLAKETLGLGLLGGLGGVLLAMLLLRVAGKSVGVELPHWVELQVDPAVCAIAVGACLACALGAAFVAAWRALRIDVSHALKQGGGGTAQGSPMQLALVVVQVAAGFALTAAGTTLVERLSALQSTTPGFDPRGVLLVEVNPTYRSAETAEIRVGRFERLLQGIARLRGVEAAGCNNSAPFLPQRPWNRSAFGLEGQDEAAQRANPIANFQTVSADYFRTMRIPLVSGRAFDDRDQLKALQTTIISKALAERLFPGADPLGKRLQLGPAGSYTAEDWRLIVGVVGDVRHQSLEGMPAPDIYLPATQLAWKQTTFLIRARDGVEPMSLLPAVRQEAAALADETGVFGARLLTDLVGASLWQERLRSVAVGAFASASLLLTGFGLASLAAQTVLRRRREFGIRLAIGANSTQLARSVVQRLVALTAAGVALGAIGVFALARVFPAAAAASLSHAALGALLLAVVAVLAAWLPARRVARIQPAEVLRAE